MQLQNNQWKNIWTAQLAWNVLETQARGEKPKAVLMSQSGCALATSEGLGIPSGYWSLPMLRSCFTTLINNLSVKHTIGQQMILFHRFSDLMNYSLTLYPRCWSGERLLKRKRQRNFNMYHTQARVHERFLFQKDFFFFCSFFSPPFTNPHQLYFVNISWVRTPRGWQISCNLPDLPCMSGAVVFLYPSKCYWVWKIINLDPVQHLWKAQYGFFFFLPALLNYTAFSSTHSWPRCSG